MQKITKFSRKRARTGGLYNEAAGLQVLQRCKSYSDAPAACLEAMEKSMQNDAGHHLYEVRMALHKFLQGEVAPSNEDYFDALSLAFSLGCIRAGQIAGHVVSDNPMLQVLVLANQALGRTLKRRQTWKKWELDHAARPAMVNAVEVYVTILQASSPEQMHQARLIQQDWLKGKVLETINEVREIA